MKGLELAEKYFETYGMPLIQKKFKEYEKRIAAGLVGDGSECYGYDDEISRDHDWGPGFCVWLTKEDYEKIGKDLEYEIYKLPKVFMGYGPRKVSDWGLGRIGVFEISQFYANFIGLDHIPKDNEEWLYIPESSLAACTNGRVFYDPLGEFSRWREKLLEFYPEDVRLKKIASRCMTIAQSGQYNFGRCVKRKEYFAAQYCETKFCADVISLIFLLNRRYTPFFKWMHRALKELPILGKEIHQKILNLVTTNNYQEKVDIIESICSDVITQLRIDDLSSSNSSFLLDHGPEVQRRIKDRALRERNVWVG
ncbi:hypothetical protein JCM12298_24440 [Desulfothermus naphthae]